VWFGLNLLLVFGLPCWCVNERCCDSTLAPMCILQHSALAALLQPTGARHTSAHFGAHACWAVQACTSMLKICGPSEHHCTCGHRPACARHQPARPAQAYVPAILPFAGRPRSVSIAPGLCLPCGCPPGLWRELPAAHWGQAVVMCACRWSAPQLWVQTTRASSTACAPRQAHSSR